MELNSGPVHLPGLGRIFQHRHEQIAHSLELDPARTARARLTRQRVDPATIKGHNPESHHPLAPTKKLGDLRPRPAHEQRADGTQTPITALVRRGFHRHEQLRFARVLPIGFYAISAQ